MSSITQTMQTMEITYMNVKDFTVIYIINPVLFLWSLIVSIGIFLKNIWDSCRQNGKLRDMTEKVIGYELQTKFLKKKRDIISEKLNKVSMMFDEVKTAYDNEVRRAEEVFHKMQEEKMYMCDEIEDLKRRLYHNNRFPNRNNRRNWDNRPRNIDNRPRSRGSNECRREEQRKEEEWKNKQELKRQEEQNRRRREEEQNRRRREEEQRKEWKNKQELKEQREQKIKIEEEQRHKATEVKRRREEETQRTMKNQMKEYVRRQQKINKGKTTPKHFGSRVEI